MTSRQIALIAMQKIRKHDSCTIERCVDGIIKERKLSNVNKDEIYALIKATLQGMEYCRHNIAQ